MDGLRKFLMRRGGGARQERWRTDVRREKSELEPPRPEDAARWQPPEWLPSRRNARRMWASVRDECAVLLLFANYTHPADRAITDTCAPTALDTPRVAPCTRVRSRLPRAILADSLIPEITTIASLVSTVFDEQVPSVALELTADPLTPTPVPLGPDAFAVKDPRMRELCNVVSGALGVAPERGEGAREDGPGLDGAEDSDSDENGSSDGGDGFVRDSDASHFAAAARAPSAGGALQRVPSREGAAVRAELGRAMLRRAHSGSPGHSPGPSPAGSPTERRGASRAAALPRATGDWGEGPALARVRGLLEGVQRVGGGEQMLDRSAPRARVRHLSIAPCCCSGRRRRKRSHSHFLFFAQAAGGAGRAWYADPHGGGRHAAA